MKKHDYFVYILCNKIHTVFYTGVTSNLEGRIYKHKHKVYKKSFSSKYNIDKLVYYEHYKDIRFAIAREKQIKKYKRAWKLNLILKMNPTVRDLSEDLEVVF